MQSAMQIGWKIGVEVELLAPPHSSRRALAEHLAQARGGRVRAYFLPQSEPSRVAGMETFKNLTMAFAAEDAHGTLIARCVDDLTLQSDLDRRRPPEPGWFRVVSDDMRLLRLAQRHCRADSGIRGAVEGLAELFGTAVQPGGDQMLRVVDDSGASVAIAAPLPGERHRPCELITPPIAADHAAQLDALLAPARQLGFTLAAEAATHIHFDATPLQSAAAVRALARLIIAHGDNLKRLVATNPRCRRLGGWPPALRDCVEAPDFVSLPWQQARDRLRRAKLSKYCDVNIKNLVTAQEDKHTVEFRILPGMMDTAPILAAAALFEGILRRACAPVLVPAMPPQPWMQLPGLLESLPMDEAARAHWLAVAATR